MDSEPFDSDTVFPVSDQSGSLSSFSAQNSDKETLAQKPAMDFDDINNSSVSVNDGDGGSENEGFVSGDEEFETAQGRPIMVSPDEKFTQGPAVKSPEYEFFTPKAARPVANVSVDDDDDGGDDDGVEGDEGGGRSLGFSREGSEDKLGIEDYKEDLVQRESNENVDSDEVVKESGFGDSHEGFVEAYSGDIKGSESVKLDENWHSVSEGGLTSEKDDEVVKEQNSNDGGDIKGSESVKLDENWHSVHEGGLTSKKDEEVVKEQNGNGGVDNKGSESVKLDDNSHSVSEGGLTSEKDEEVVKEQNGNGGGEVVRRADTMAVGTVNDKSVENGDVKLTSAGDVVVTTLEVDVLGSGAAVVGDKEEVNDYEIKGMEAPASDVSMDNRYVPIDEAAEEPFDEFATRDAKSDQNADPVADDDIEHAQEGLLGQKNSIIDPLENGENIEAVTDEGKIISRAEAPSESLASETRDAKSDQNADPVADDDIEHAQEGLLGQKSIIEPLEKGENIEADVDEEKTGSHVEASGGSLLSETRDAKSDHNADPVADDDIEHAQEGLLGQKNIIEPLEKGEKIEADANEGKIGSHGEAPGEPLASETRDAKSDQNAVPVADDDIEHAQEGLLGQKSIIESLEKGENIEAEADEEKICRHVEAPGEPLASETRDAKSDQNADPVADDDIEHAQEGLLGQKSITESLEKGENIKADADEGQIGSHVEVPDPIADDGIEHAQEGLLGKKSIIESLEKGEVIEADAYEGKIGSHVEAPGESLASETRDAKSDQNADPDDDIEHAQEGLLGQQSIIEPLEKGENIEADADERTIGSHVEAPSESLASETVDPISSSSRAIKLDEDGEDKHLPDGREIDGSVSDGEGDGVIFGSSEAARRFLEELEQRSGVVSQSGAESSQDTSQRIDGQIVTDSDEEVESVDGEGGGKELFDPAALAALLKAAKGAVQDSGSITITPQDSQRLFSVERPAGLGPSLQSVRPAPRPNSASLFAPNVRTNADSESNLSEEERKKLEKLQQIRIKFLRLVQRLGYPLEESLVAQVLYRLNLIAGRYTGQLFNLDAAKLSASQLEEEGKNDLDFSLNILVLGKTGVGKSATINSIFGEKKTTIDAYGPATTAVREIVGMVDGVKIRIFDTPGLKSSAMEQGFNQKVLSVVKKLTKKSPLDIVLYVDRLDTQSRDSNDLPLLKTISSVLGPSTWRSAIVTLTHAGSAPPDGPSGSPMSYEVFVAQRSHIVQQHIGQAVGDLRLMNPSLMNIVTLVENHPSCRKNRDGQKVLPNGQVWRPQLLLISYSMKILSEAGNLSKTQDSFDHRRLLGFRMRSPPLPYLLSWLLQSRSHPKLPADQGGDHGDSDVELADLSDSDLDEDEDEYDQLPPFKPLRKSQISKLSKEQRKAYFEEYDYRVKLLQKKQWREELKRMREMKKKGKTNVNDYGNMEEDDPENESPAAVQVPLPEMVLPPSFDSDNPAYRYRFLEPTSQLLTRPVLDTQGWDHDCGYDGVNIEQNLAIINRFPAAVTVQLRKDKKEFSLHLDSSVAAKRGENQSIMAGFDIQNIGKQLAYIIRGETKFKNLKRNKTAAGFSVTFLGENVSTGVKIEDQIALGKRLAFVGSMGTVRSQGDSAYGANVEVQLRDADYPIGQDQHSLGLSLVKWRGDLALGTNFQSQFSLGRSYKMAVRAGLNNKMSGQFTVRTSSSDQLQIALLAVLPIAKAIYHNFWPGASENYSIY